jgi:hypothetical protein
MNDNIELDPLCFKGSIAFAVTNRGHLIPCCRCDDPLTINDPEFQKLLSVSKISEYDSIDQILATNEWKEFEENLRNHTGPDACIRTCQKHKSQNTKQVIKVIDPDNILIHKDIR